MEPVFNHSVTGGRIEAKKEALKRACQDFEAMFLSRLLKSMHSGIETDGFFEKSHTGDMINQMFDENLARSIARQGGIGIAKILYEQMLPRIELKE